MLSKKKLKTIDLFCGAGGLSEGFSQAGFEVVYANDSDKNCIKSFSANHPGAYTHLSDIKSVKTKDILDSAGLKKGEVDLIIGGPPCQGFSTVGKRWLEDPRNFLFKEYFRILKGISPKMFVFENVKGILSMDGGKVIEEIVRLFSSIGYETDYEILNAVEHGVPQVRERVFVVGVRKGLPKFEFPEPTHSTNGVTRNSKIKRALTLKTAISDLPSLNSGEKASSYASFPKNEYQRQRRKKANGLLYHEAANHGRSLLRVISKVPEGGDIRSIPTKYRPKTGFPNTYARLWWDKPSTTVTRNFSTPSSSRCIHPKTDRGLTAREAARLQSFDDDYIFLGPKGSRHLQIGNAVPPLLARAVAKQARKLLNSTL